MLKNKILFYGIGTYKNRGVEAIINASIKLLGNENIKVATFDYNYNKKIYSNNIKYINHHLEPESMSQKNKALLESLISKNASRKEQEKIYQSEVIDAIAEADICISAGGDNYCYGNNDWLFAIDEEVKKQNKKLVLWGASLYEKIENVDLINDMNLFDILLIRESISYNAISKFVPKEKLILAPDPAFALETKPVKMDDFYENSKVVGINLSPLTIPDISDENKRFKEVINLINYILKNTKYKISLIPHVTTDECSDLSTLKAIYRKFENNNRVFLEKDIYDCCQIKYIISKCELMIAARTHASIAAYSTTVPTLVIGYSVKSKGIATDIFGTHTNYVISSADINENKLVNSFIWLDKNKNKIRKNLVNKMPTYILESQQIYEKVLNRIKENNKNNICHKDECIGCGLCKINCPTGAISLHQDNIGFVYPKIDFSKCINCDICRKKCPINRKVEKSKFIPLCYAVKNKEDEIRAESTSGGIFTILAKKVIAKKGAVYGATQENLSVKHIRINNKKDLKKIRGSKYSQSNLSGIIEDLKTDKSDNRYILVSGTPCQIAFFKSLLKDYNKVLYVSVICHGVISEELTKRYLREEYPEQDVINFQYRNKEKGWSKASVKIETSEKCIIEEFKDNTLMGLFNLNTILRESCYNCKFKLENNEADIILGDYWGVSNFHPEIFDEKGVSALIINSENGKKFLDNNQIWNEMIYKKSKMENLKIGNPVLFESPKKPIRRYTIEEDLETMKLKHIQTIDYLKYQLENEQIRLNKIIEEEKNKNTKIQEELNKVYNSKRWKVANKVFNTLGKVRRNGRG